MFIVSKDRKSIVNADHATCIYVGEKQGIKMTTSTGAGFRLGFYNSELEAGAALEELAKHMASSPVYFLPDDATAALIVKQGSSDTRPDRYHGTKPQRRGGS